MLRKWSLKVIQWLDWLDRAVSWTWWLYFGVVLLVTFEVVMRYFLNSAHDWGEEVIIAASVWATLLASGRATKVGRHISLEIIYASLKGQPRRVADIANGIITIVICGILTVFVFQWGMFLDRMGMTQPSTLGMPLSVIAYALCAGMALNTLFGLEILLRAILAIPSDVEVAEELERTYVKY